VSGSSLQHADHVAFPGQNEKRRKSLVERAKSGKFSMGPVRPSPWPPSLASPRQGERGGGAGVAFIPLVDLSEVQAAVWFASAHAELGGDPC
jgi:hypothetical protein